MSNWLLIYFEVGFNTTFCSSFNSLKFSSKTAGLNWLLKSMYVCMITHNETSGLGVVVDQVRGWAAEESGHLQFFFGFAEGHLDGKVQSLVLEVDWREPSSSFTWPQPGTLLDLGQVTVSQPSLPHKVIYIYLLHLYISHLTVMGQWTFILLQASKERAGGQCHQWIEIHFRFHGYFG